ncbi:MAG: DUF1847 domain-containing protein [Pleomorphochaeta sp.]
MKTLYDKKSLEIMKVADKTSNMSLNRLEQIKAFALEANYKGIGIAYCITFRREAYIIKEYLESDFQIFTVDCKYGRLSKKELFNENSSRVLCNPAGQAQYLNDKNTDLNISIGLCVGHDMIFNRVSNALVTCVYTKDFTNNNDMDQAIYDISK